LLHLDRAAHRIDDAGKLHEQAVAHRLYDPALVFHDLRIAEFTAHRTEHGESAVFVLAHQP